MKELDIGTFVAVLQEMMGPLLWVILVAAALATLGFVYVLVRDRGLVARRLVWSEALGVIGGVGGVLLMHEITHSDFADIGGPIDWVVVAAIFVLGAVGTVVGAYTVLGLFFRRAA
ncbi:DUF5368 domain-containing protein [Roseomonas eburnea]|uniref:DUF5368 domain-containing protein n=1 Tax=Neoroseomonas eburnea TaxID=1346889 RepID=A0A9X9XCH2_9PROT|nr:DUF5368 domain-containing protein [Neoroseomonas eburnea]MBR0681408.1 DUF5368 domain-containing protein [Neoroseomonas eburnea]